MSKYTKIIRIIVSILLILTTSFIFYNSLLDGKESLEVSVGFYDKIKPLFDIFLPERFNNIGFIRKLAHFTEFAVLSFELSYIFLLDKNIKNITAPLFFGLLTALSDETIQMFTSRGSAIKDIWIDFAGVVTAVIIYLLLSLILKGIMKHFQKKD